MRANTFDRYAEEIEALYVEASSLTRLLRLMGRPDPEQDDVDLMSPFALLTAYRADLTQVSNAARNRQMRSVLSRNGLTAYKVDGNWLEEQGEEVVRIPEEALFCVPAAEMPFSEFETLLVKQADYFDQTAIMLIDGENMWVRFKDGHISNLGARVDVGAIERAYQKMRGQREHDFEFV